MRRVLDAMTPEQRVGQPFMVGAAATGTAAASLSAIDRYHVGSVILSGLERAGVSAVRAVVDTLQRRDGGLARLYVAADQEGGQVQALRGPGFSDLPTALAQGQLAPSRLRADWQSWGRQLAAAGVNLDLAPVLDTVPADRVTTNRVDGIYQREYGHDPRTVASHGVAVLRGLHDAGVGSAVKHFPGLGRVTGNTDFTAGVVDDETTRGDPYLRPFRAAVRSGVGVVMVALARYQRIDPGRLAVFSPTVMRSLLRGDLGFDGVIISDDMGAAAAVNHVPPGQRAVRFFAAGGDLLLTVEPTDIPVMTAAVRDQARRDAGFAARVHDAAVRVLISKQRAGLLRCGP